MTAEQTPKATRKGAPRDGCWAVLDNAASTDGECLPLVAVFSREVDALRFAVKVGLTVERLPYGADLRVDKAVTT